MRTLILFFIRFYQLCVSPFTPNSCRFIPSCSCYTYDAVLKYGAIKGVFLGIKRLLRCHPFSKGGFDPVP